MELLHPRRAYHRANSDDPSAHQETFEMMSVYSNTDSKHDLPTLQEYSSDYHLRSNPDQIPLIEPSTHAKWFSGWRAGAYSAAGLASCSLTINFIAVIWLSKHPDSDSNLVEVFKGSCDTVAHMDTWVHLAINALSTLLLGGSNYCMQCLCAPSRKEIEKAHSRGRFLDIGVPSFRNLSSIASYKVVMWWLLGLSSIPLHLMYNSAFYSSLATNDYIFYVVASEFLSGANASYVHPSGYYDVYLSRSAEKLQQDIASNDTVKFERLDALACIKTYGQVFMQDYRNLVMVSKNSSTSSNSSVLYGDDYAFEVHIDPPQAVYTPFDWICRSDPKIGTKIDVPPDPNQYKQAPCDSYLDRIEAIADSWQPWGYDIDYCLAERIEQKCSFNGNIPIISTVIVCNTVKVILMLMVAYRLSGNPLITIGDALESFLEIPDETTKGLCLFDRSNAEACEELTNSRIKNEQPLWQYKEGANSKTAKLEILRWSKAASGRRWTMTIGLIILALISVLGFLGGAIAAIKDKNISFMDLGFGTVHASAIISGWNIERIPNPSLQIIAAIFIANLPQAILSFLYLNLNGLLTSMWVALEWSKFAKERKHLRVSTPKGQQRSTHFLQLPYKIAIPLMTMSGLLHWLISQSIFLAVVADYDEVGGLNNAVQIASCGFSPLAMICVLVLGVLLIIGTYLLGRLKYDPSMPLAGSCTAAISAACHRPDWDVDASLGMVQWGVIPGSEGESGVGHCCFTSGGVEPIQNGKQYAGNPVKRLPELRKRFRTTQSECMDEAHE